MTDNKNSSNDIDKSAGNKNDQKKKQTGIEQLFLIFMILLICVCIAFSISISGRHDSRTGATPGLPDSLQNKQEITNNKQAALQTPPSICANLIYEDGTLSEFDLIDNEDITLWNTTIGEGSAEKPSFATQISILPGDASIDSLTLKISTPDSVILKTSIKDMPLANEQRVITINNTGCTKLFISLLSNNNTILEKQIPFECRE